MSARREPGSDLCTVQEARHIHVGALIAKCGQRQSREDDFSLHASEFEVPPPVWSSTAAGACEGTKRL
jgi:hypothetical protein